MRVMGPGTFLLMLSGALALTGTRAGECGVRRERSPQGEERGDRRVGAQDPGEDVSPPPGLDARPSIRSRVPPIPVAHLRLPPPSLHPPPLFRVSGPMPPPGPLPSDRDPRREEGRLGLSPSPSPGSHPMTYFYTTWSRPRRREPQYVEVGYVAWTTRSSCGSTPRMELWAAWMGGVVGGAGGAGVLGREHAESRSTAEGLLEA
ncbi:uncharacterized protein LOC109439708 [Rhinolophus sinicus]|uniref:uncharacterized protein LOC109439708 n=1 Tax=Rhinolophus sinicus TaxID=89399 RepID=UPI003D799739